VETDNVLIERSVQGRPDAFVAVVQRHEAAIHGFLSRRAGRHVADDLLGEVWVRAFAGRGSYDLSYRDARPWLYGIARNVLRAHWRASVTADAASGSDVAGAGSKPEEVADPWDDIVDRLDSAALARALVSAVRALPPAEREVLLLVAWEQLSPAEAAVALGVPPGTARSRLHRARAKLRCTLAGTDLNAEVSK
jgi:RNA polymerase sigma-70 factor (ECF subfamily)